MKSTMFRFLACHTPSALRSTLNLIPVDKLDIPTGEDRFSPRYVMAHLAEYESYYLRWMQQALESPGAHIEIPDADAQAEKNKYATRDVWEELEMLSERRRMTIEFIMARSPEETNSLTVVCPFRQAITLADQCTFVLGHDLYHLEQLLSVVKR